MIPAPINSHCFPRIFSPAPRTEPPGVSPCLFRRVRYMLHRVVVLCVRIRKILQLSLLLFILDVCNRRQLGVH